MNITLDSNPSDAPGCLKLIADNGEDRLIQTDWDWPGIANTFGWNIKDVQNKPACYSDWEEGRDVSEEEDKACQAFADRPPCDHSGTDGTIDCKACGCTARAFIQAARQWLDDNDGAEIEDPGYFGE